MTTADIDVWAGLTAGLNSVARELRQQNDALRREASSLWPVEAPALSLAALPAFNTAYGPNTGYAWAVQRLTVGPWGATTDAVTIYRGRAGVDVQTQNALFSLTGAAGIGTFASVLPGKGLILMPDESLVVAGTITGANPMMSWDVLQMETWVLPYYIN